MFIYISHTFTHKKLEISQNKVVLTDSQLRNFNVAIFMILNKKNNIFKNGLKKLTFVLKNTAANTQ